MHKERSTVRDLARQVAEIASLPEQAEKIRLWTACNDLKPERPMVLLNPQNGWDELLAAWLTLECSHPLLRHCETELRKALIRHRYLPDDFPVIGAFQVPLHVAGNGYDDYGVRLTSRHATTAKGAYHIEPVIKSEADMEKLRPRPIEIHMASSRQRQQEVQDLIGDILPVTLAGKTNWRYGLTRVLIDMLGFEEMMLAMYDHPGLVHSLMAFLRDDFQTEIELFEQARAVGLNNRPDHITGSGGLSPTKDLPSDKSMTATRTGDCICWGESQETVAVGPAQFDEFVLQYQLPLLERFGLVDYGCCESLDYKLDLLKAKIPNLRWVAVAPWSNRQMCADKIGDEYVYVYKPNPSRICSSTPDWSGAEAEIRETLDIARGCATHIVMKDTSTFCNEPSRATKWCEMAVRAAIEA